MLQVLLGGLLTIIGGIAGAWLQNARSDNIAQAIRRAQRREDALLALQSKCGEVIDAVVSIRKAAAQRGAVTAQYVAALAKLRELSALWLWHSVGAIPDRGIIMAYALFDGTVRQRLPGDEGALKYMEANITSGKADDQAAQFVADLDTVLAMLRQFADEVQVQVVGLLHPQPSWLRRVLIRRRAWLSRSRAIMKSQPASPVVVDLETDVSEAAKP